MSTLNNLSCKTRLEYRIGKGKYHRNTWEQGNQGHFRGKNLEGPLWWEDWGMGFTAAREQGDQRHKIEETQWTSGEENADSGQDKENWLTLSLVPNTALVHGGANTWLLNEWVQVDWSLRTVRE